VSETCKQVSQDYSGSTDQRCHLQKGAGITQ